MDAVVLLNDRYAAKGLRCGDVGTVMENRIADLGFVICDFADPVSGASLSPVAEIGKDDFRVLSDSPADRRIFRAFCARFSR